jgi:hypothetical protein
MSNKETAATELKIALDNRAFEIQLFWQRSNYFLVLMTALGVATFSIKDVVFSPLIAALSTAASYFWFRTNLGSKFWQESWEFEVVALAKEQKIRSFERTTLEVIDQVKNSLSVEENENKKSYLRKFIDRMIIKKYSVTYNMILLSMISTFLWSVVTVVFVVRLVDHYCSFQNGCLRCTSERIYPQPPLCILLDFDRNVQPAFAHDPGPTFERPANDFCIATTTAPERISPSAHTEHRALPPVNPPSQPSVR